MKTTYFLGAGASYNAIPIVDELSAAFSKMEKHCNSIVAGQSELDSGRRIFSENLTEFALMSLTFGTIDTYAKKLFLTDPKRLEKFKAVLTTFFNLWQEADMIALSTVREQERYYFKDKKFQKIDQRYLGLLANFIEKSENNLTLNQDVNFVTWNYDTQLERAISTFVDKSLITVLENYNVYPFKSENQTKSQIIHLNGIAGVYKFVDKDDFRFLFSQKIEKENNLYKRMLRFMSQVENSEISMKDCFSYAWEQDEISKRGVEKSISIFEQTEVLIIIGYSFPTFNDEVDKKLMNALKQSKKLRMIYYQDPKASEELLYTRFGIVKEKIKIVKDVTQFILPLDSHTINPNANWTIH